MRLINGIPHVDNDAYETREAKSRFQAAFEVATGGGMAASYDHNFEPGAFGVCRRCGEERHGTAGSSRKADRVACRKERVMIPNQERYSDPNLEPSEADRKRLGLADPPQTPPPAVEDAADPGPPPEESEPKKDRRTRARSRLTRP